jgi:hypothetical protein
MTRARSLALIAAAAALSLTACEKQIEAPMNKGVCWQLVERGGKIVFNKVSANEPRIETCAASLEAMRLRFLSLGGSAVEIDGAYQGNFLFLRRQGIFMSQQFKGARYPLLLRTEDGDLVKLGAAPPAASGAQGQ